MTPFPVKGLRGIFFMFSLKGLTPYLWAISVLGGAYISYSLTSSYYQIKIAVYEKKQAQVLNQALEDKAKKENVFNGVLADAQSNIALDVQHITSTYNRYHFNGLFSDTYSVHTDTADSSQGLSTDTTTTKAISQSTCKCNGADKAKLQRLYDQFQRLYEQQLIISRDYDITATYYNNLIDLYNGVKQ